ncbi:MAG TPA: hypothetical protein VGX23_26660 [Actinocrinis sp.]|nr:hypothetical protein [Actinocrinis sp.]
MRQRPRGNAPSGWSAEDLGPAEDDPEESAADTGPADLLWLAEDVAPPVEIDGAVLPYVVLGKGVHGSDRTDLWRFEPAAPPELDLSLFKPVGEVSEPSLADSAIGHWQPDAPTTQPARPEPVQRPEPVRGRADAAPAPVASSASSAGRPVPERDPFAPRRPEPAAGGRRAAEAPRSENQSAAAPMAAVAETEAERTRARRSRHAGLGADLDPAEAAMDRPARTADAAPAPYLGSGPVSSQPTESEGEADEPDVYDLVAAAFGRPGARTAAARAAESKPAGPTGPAAPDPAVGTPKVLATPPAEPAEPEISPLQVPDLAKPEPAPVGRRGLRRKPEPEPESAEFRPRPQRAEPEPPALWRAAGSPADVPRESNVANALPGTSSVSARPAGSGSPQRPSGSSPQRTYGRPPAPEPEPSSSPLAATMQTSAQTSAAPIAKPAPLLPLPDDRPARPADPTKPEPQRSADRYPPAEPAIPDRLENSRSQPPTRPQPTRPAADWPPVQPVIPDLPADPEPPVVGHNTLAQRPAVERPDLAWPEFSWPEAAADSRGPFEPKLTRTKQSRPRFDSGFENIEFTHIHGPLVEPQQVPLPESLSDAGWLDTVHWNDESGQDGEEAAAGADAEAGRRAGPFRRKKGSAA